MVSATSGQAAAVAKSMMDGRACAQKPISHLRLARTHSHKCAACRCHRARARACLRFIEIERNRSICSTRILTRARARAAITDANQTNHLSHLCASASAAGQSSCARVSTRRTMKPHARCDRMSDYLAKTAPLWPPPPPIFCLHFDCKCNCRCSHCIFECMNLSLRHNRGQSVFVPCARARAKPIVYDWLMQQRAQLLTFLN